MHYFVFVNDAFSFCLLSLQGMHQKMDELQQMAHKEVRSQQEATADQR